MNNAERYLIECVCDGDIKKSQEQARVILVGLTTEKDKKFREHYLNKLDMKQAELVELPYDLRKLLIAENSALFQVERFVLRAEEKGITETLLNAYSVANQLAELRIKYTPSLILYGESGTGKTELARYIAYKAELPFVYVNFSNLVSQYLGNTQANVAKVFDYVKRTPCVLCFDEIDAVGMARGKSDDIGEMSRVTIALMQELDKLPNNVIIIGTTNRFDMLDKALVRRFQLKHKVNALSMNDINELATRFFNSAKVDMSAWFDAWLRLNFKDSDTAATVISKCTDNLVSMLIAERKLSGGFRN